MTTPERFSTGTYLNRDGRNKLSRLILQFRISISLVCTYLFVRSKKCYFFFQLDFFLFYINLLITGYLKRTSTIDKFEFHLIGNVNSDPQTFWMVYGEFIIFFYVIRRLPKHLPRRLILSLHPDWVPFLRGPVARSHPDTTRLDTVYPGPTSLDSFLYVHYPPSPFLCHLPQSSFLSFSGKLQSYGPYRG